MQTPTASHHEGFQPSTLPEAARILGVSESTVRRLVKAGKLEAERVLRPQGHVWMVMVPAPSTGGGFTRQQVATTEGSHPPSSEGLAAWTRSVLEPLVAELSVSRQQLVSQAETIGRLRAELDALRALPDGQERPQEACQPAERSEPSPEPPAPPEPFPAPIPPSPNGEPPAWWRRWLAAVVG